MIKYILGIYELSICFIFSSINIEFILLVVHGILKGLRQMYIWKACICLLWAIFGRNSTSKAVIRNVDEVSILIFWNFSNVIYSFALDYTRWLISFYKLTIGLPKIYKFNKNSQRFNHTKPLVVFTCSNNLKSIRKIRIKSTTINVNVKRSN